jgi:hypothetical protein
MSISKKKILIIEPTFLQKLKIFVIFINNYIQKQLNSVIK